MKQMIAQANNPSDRSQSKIPPTPRPAKGPSQGSEAPATMTENNAVSISTIPPIITRAVSTLTPVGLGDRSVAWSLVSQPEHIVELKAE